MTRLACRFDPIRALAAIVLSLSLGTPVSAQQVTMETLLDRIQIEELP